MIKRKKSISLAIAALSAISLSGCSSVTVNSDGGILTYTYNGREVTISTAEIIDRYLNQDRNNHAAAFYNALNEVVIRRAFEEGGQLAEFKTTVDNQATDDVNKAKDTADSNGQSWEDFLASNVTGQDLTTEERENEYFLQQQYNRMQETVEEQYFENFNSYQKDTTDTTAAEMQDEYNLLYGTNGYIQKKVPYHIRHILVQVDANQDYGYSRGHISSEDAHQIYQVVSALVNGNSFANVANLYTDDPGNEQNGTNLGGEYIMDNSTSFVNEFKLGIYTYDLLLNNTYDKEDATYQAKFDNLHIPESVQETLEDFGVTFIPYGVINQLEAVKDTTTDSQGRTLYDGDEDYLPRNIYFNKYFQNRNVGFITPDRLLTKAELQGQDSGVNYVDYENSADGTGTNAMYTRTDNVSGKKVFSDVDNTGHYVTSNEVDPSLTEEQLSHFQEITINGITKKVLCDTNGNPILVARNQESSSGIHFIVIERSAFDVAGGTGDNAYKASIEEYYAPVSPKTIDGINPTTGRPYWTTDGTFPVYEDNGVTLPKQTYVQTEVVRSTSNIINTVDAYTTRVSTLSDSVKTAIDTYDTFEWLNPSDSADRITLNDIAGKDIQAMVDTYIQKEIRASDDSSAQTLEDSWAAYANAILQQTRQREYMLLPEILATDFGNPDLYKNGAPGYNAKYDSIYAGVSNN